MCECGYRGCMADDDCWEGQLMTTPLALFEVASGIVAASDSAEAVCMAYQACNFCKALAAQTIHLLSRGK